MPNEEILLRCMSMTNKVSIRLHRNGALIIVYYGKRRDDYDAFGAFVFPSFGIADLKKFLEMLEEDGELSDETKRSILRALASFAKESGWKDIYKAIVVHCI